MASACGHLSITPTILPKECAPSSSKVQFFSGNGIVNHTAYKDILDNWALPTCWGQFGEASFHQRALGNWKKILTGGGLADLKPQQIQKTSF